MDSKEIKSALKAAKESLEQKDYKSAIKHCKSVLKLDRNNYLAFVFYGAAIQETEQKDEASKAFKKAIEISPDHILAWRGLALFYEKNENPSDSSDLLKVYERLLSLESDLTKFTETVEKLQKLNNVHYHDSHVKFVFDLLSSIAEEKKLMLQQYIVSILESNLPADCIVDYQKLLADLLSKRPYLENHLDLQKKYFKVLYNQKKYEEIISEGLKVLELYSDNINLLEWICRAYIKLSEINSNQITSDFMPHLVYTKLLESTPDSYLGNYCKGLHLFNTSDYIGAVDSLQEAARLKPSSESVLLKLCQCQILLYRFSDAESNCRKALKLIETNDNKESMLFFNVNLLKSLCEQEEQEKWLEGKNLGVSLLEENPSNIEILKYLSKVCIVLEEFIEADKIIAKIKEKDQNEFLSNYLECFSLKQKNKLDDYKMSLEKLVEKFPDNFELWLELGKLHYVKNNSESCILCLLKAAKLDQWCYWSFLFLGHYYKTMAKDFEKARRCYQKAYQLNPLSAEVGNNLSDVYRILGKVDLNSQLLAAATTLNSKSQWAWVKLGLQYLSTNQYQEAMNSLQTAVRLDPDDKNAWEYLGDAYFSLGAYTSAIKSYNKVIELDENAVYSMLQIANIKHLIGQYQESIDEFRIVNAQKINYIPALKGHAEACLSLMKHYLSENLNGLAQDICQEAVTLLVKCLALRKDLICIWKLLGDSCALLSSLPEKYCNIKIDSWLCGDPNTKCSDEKTTLNKLQIMKLSCRSYCQAISINSNLWGLWYDLAYIYNCMVEMNKTEESKKQMRKLACAAVKKSILLNKNSWESWNLYGVILASKEIQNYYIAQHCFIQSITQLDTNAVTWTNLGTLYLELDDLQLANLSFTEAQKCDHNYVLCWVGQAIIAQITNHHDAMDLFRHSTELGFSSEGCLGYSTLVCQTILNTKNKNDKNYLYSIKNMNAISLVCDGLTWYTDRFPTDPWAFNMLGLVLERQMLFKSSAEAYSRALELVRLEKVRDEDKDSHLERVDKILLNYSRILSNLKKYDEALNHLKQIAKATFQNQCELAAAYFRAKRYEEAYSTYETTLEWLAPNVEMKSHILVAMAAVVYLHQGQEDAKILLMQSCQLKPASVQGLFACCALGMLHSDLALSELSLKELNVYKNDLRYLSDIAVFQAYIFLFKGQHNKAVRALCEVIHRYPDQPSLWLNLSLLLLHLYSYFGSKNAAECAEVALISGRSTIDVSKVMYLVSLGNLLSGEGLKSLRSSQKAVHMFPDVTENWVVLLASVLSKCLVRQSVEEIFWLKKMVTYIRRKFESSKSMTQWLSNNNRKIIMMAEKLVS